jgi:hypothetical protein
MATNISSNSATVESFRSYRGGASAPLKSEAGRVLQHQRVPGIEDDQSAPGTGNAVEISLSREKAAEVSNQTSDSVLDYREFKSKQSLSDLMPEANLPSVHEMRAALASREMEAETAIELTSKPNLSTDEALETALRTADLIRREAEASLHAQGSHLSAEMLSLTDNNKGSNKRAKAVYQAQANLLTRNSTPS